MKKHLITTALALTSVTVISKFTGLVREITLAFLFGTTIEMDAYLVALIIPVIVFESFGEALRLAFIPVIADYLDDDNRLWLFFNNLINIIFIITLAISLIGVYIIPRVIPYLPFGFNQEGMELTAYLGQITIFIIIFTSLAPISQGLLNLKNVFIYPELTGIFYSIILIIFAFLGSRFWGIGGLALGAVVGEMMKFVFLIPVLYRQGFRYRFYINLKDSAHKRLVKLMVPIILRGVLSKIHIFIERVIGSFLLPGSISALNYAKMLLTLCTGLIESVAVTLIYPTLSKYFVSGSMKKYKLLLSKAVGLLAIILIPCMTGLIILRQPIVSAFFERGAFDQYAVLMTSSALLFYSFGILGLVFESLFERSFFAIKDSKTPVICASIGIVINIILNFIFAGYMGHGGIALAASVSTNVAAVLMFIRMLKKVGWLGLKRTAVTFIKVFAASLVMAGVLYFLNHIISMNHYIKLFILILSGIIIYSSMLMVLKLKELKKMLQGTVLNCRIRN